MKVQLKSTPMTTLLLIGIIAAGIRYGFWVSWQRRVIAVEPNFLWQSGAMNAKALTRFVKHHQIGMVIDFRRIDEPLDNSEAIVLDGLKVQYLKIPCDRSPTMDSIATFLSTVRQQYKHNCRILMHCKDGEGRAVFFGGIYRIEFQGMMPRSAYLAQRRLPPDLHWLRFIVPNIGLFSKNNSKTQLLLNYR